MANIRDEVQEEIDVELTSEEKGDDDDANDRKPFEENAILSDDNESIHSEEDAETVDNIAGTTDELIRQSKRYPLVVATASSTRRATVGEASENH